MFEIWKFIFKTSPTNELHDDNAVVAAARKAGYKMFCFNGGVYAVPAEKSAEPRSLPLFRITTNADTGQILGLTDLNE